VVHEVPQRPLPDGVLLFQPFRFDLLGGVDVVMDNLWRGLERRHPGLATIGIQDWVEAGDKVDEEGRRFLHLNFPAPSGPGVRRFLRYLPTLVRQTPGILRALRKKEVGLVNFHFPTMSVLPLAILKSLGLWRGRIVLTFHGSDALEIDPERPAWRFIATQVDAVTACSSALAERVAALKLFRSTPSVIYNGIDIPRFLSRIVEEELTVPTPYVLNVGTYVSHKGQDLLLDAFARIARSFPSINLVCVGGTNDGVWLAHLKELVARLGLRDRVCFLENQPQKRIATLMKHAECLAHSSHREGLPIVLIEAGACSLPLVSTRVGGIPEIIETAEQGLLVDAGNAEALASAMAAVLACPAEAKARAGNLRRRIGEHFSAESMTAGYLSAYLNA